MLVRAKLQFKGFDNATQPQKPHWESVRPVFALCQNENLPTPTYLPLPEEEHMINRPPEKLPTQKKQSKI